MYFLNYAHTCKNVAELVYARLGSVPSGADELATLYRHVVRSLRVIAPPESSYRISFEDEDIGTYIQSSGTFDEIFYGIESLSSERRKYFRALTEEALSLLHKLDRRLWLIVNLLVTDIVFLKSERVGGGSGSHLFGIVCVSPADDWDAADLMESILHEATHLNLFIGDMINSIFSVETSQLSHEDAKVVSAVRVGQMRPLDKALHSAVVAVPLMYVQHLQSRTELVDMFSDSLRTCALGLLEKGEFYTPYGHTIVQQLADFARSQDFSSLPKMISSLEFASFQKVPMTAIVYA